MSSSEKNESIQKRGQVAKIAKYGISAYIVLAFGGGILFGYWPSLYEVFLFLFVALLYLFIIHTGRLPRVPKMRLFPSFRNRREDGGKGAGN